MSIYPFKGRGIKDLSTYYTIVSKFLYFENFVNSSDLIPYPNMSVGLTKINSYKILHWMVQIVFIVQILL